MLLQTPYRRLDDKAWLLAIFEYRFLYERSRTGDYFDRLEGDTASGSFSVMAVSFICTAFI
ncbi:MAG: hypothetical protein ACTJG2_03455 [Candidatus Saccharimonadales bacterium]